MRSLGLAATEAQLREFRTEAEKKDRARPPCRRCAPLRWRAELWSDVVGKKDVESLKRLVLWEGGVKKG